MPNFSKGALYGAVVDAATGKPLHEATVAIVGPNGKILTWTKTNVDGKYAIAADTFNVLHLRPSHRRGLLEQVCRSMGIIVMAPVKVAVGVVSRPGETVKSAIEASIMGNPAPITAQVARSFMGNARSTPADAEKKAREATCVEVFSERQEAKRANKPGLCPGELSLIVTAPGYRELRSAAGAYWMEPPVTEKRRQILGVQAWLETVKMAPKSAGDKKSEVAHEALLLADAQAEPALVSAGGTIHLSVRLNNPVGFGPKVRIFAREKRRDTVVELEALNPATPDFFTGDMHLAKNLAAGETQIAIGVLRTEPLEVKIPNAKEDPLLRFAGRLDELEAGRPFEYDPRIFACENRLDVTITVLGPGQALAGSAVPLPPGRVPPPPLPPVPNAPGTVPPLSAPATSAPPTKPVIPPVSPPVKSEPHP